MSTRSSKPAAATASVLLHALPSDILMVILQYCDIRTTAALLRASAICWRLPYVPHCFGAKRQVVIALDRIRSLRLKSPWYYSTDKNTKEWWSEEYAWRTLYHADLVVPCGHLRHPKNYESEYTDIGFDINKAWYGTNYIIFNQHDNTNGFYLLALHSNEVIFSKGFDYISGTGKGGFPKDGEFWHPPRGRLPSGRKWNYTLGGYLPPITITYEEETTANTLPVSTLERPVAMSATQYLKKFCGLKNKCDPKDVMKAIGKSEEEYVLSKDGTNIRLMYVKRSNSKAGKIARWKTVKK